ncbi:hypothetical protein OMP46_09650 [Acinetobacter baumannii]|uniref:hypothetical protein n=1 Tax=Acinetobacter calcoaceticus/baumannii complex TaxID=909768 RepID=UPI0005C4DC8E|nr:MULTISPECIES: hypothetical protein [Acinetobacter calcoaceticus/baumannii complex]MCW3179790.1 hypothetical protein [Acinetobacter baumannii]BCZ10983.1 hypothetical protein OCUAc17_23580 [Acinetobacter pittii]
MDAKDFLKRYPLDKVKAALKPDMKDQGFLIRGNDFANVGELRKEIRLAEARTDQHDGVQQV